MSSTSNRKRARSERALARARRRRNQRIALAAVGVLILAAIGYSLFPKPVAEIGDPLEFPGFPVSGAEVITTSSGLQYQDLQEGSGAAAQPGDTVLVNYSGWLENGTLFDSSFNPGRQPFSFTLGVGQVIAGWEEGVAGMKPGSIRLLRIPANLAYGQNGAGNAIPPNATLIFRVELLEIQ